MADRALSTSRRALLGAAASLPFLGFKPATRTLPAGDEGLFARRLARYRTLAHAAKEAAETGWFRAANDRRNREMAAIAAIGDAAPKGACRTAFRRIDKAEKSYWSHCTQPMQRSATVLALTPVPDLPSLLAKIGVIREQELDELEIAGRPVLTLLAEDVRRLLS